jgi:hypothetical protein
MTSGSTVRSTFNYSRDTGVELEIYFYEPPQGANPRGPGDDPREMTVHDGWDRATLFSLDREGFGLHEFPSSFQYWDDDSAIREEFYGEVAECVRREVGAQRVVIFDHTIRAKRNEQQGTDEHTPPRNARPSCLSIATTPRIRVRCACANSFRTRPISY